MAAKDPHDGLRYQTLTGPSDDQYVIVPADNREIGDEGGEREITRRLIVTEQCDLHYLTKQGTENTVVGLPPGKYDWRIRKVFASDTSASPGTLIAVV